MRFPGKYKIIVVVLTGFVYFLALLYRMSWVGGEIYWWTVEPFLPPLDENYSGDYVARGAELLLFMYCGALVGLLLWALTVKWVVRCCCRFVLRQDRA